MPLNMKHPLRAWQNQSQPARRLGSGHLGLPRHSKTQDCPSGRPKPGPSREPCSVTAVNHSRQPSRQPSPPKMRIFSSMELHNSPSSATDQAGTAASHSFAEKREDTEWFFWDPYESVSVDHNGGPVVDLSPNRLGPGHFDRKKEGARLVEDFVILHWLNRKVYSAEHAEISALAHGLEEVIKRVDYFGSPSSTVKIFSDSAAFQNRLKRGILVGDDYVSPSGRNSSNNNSNMPDHAGSMVTLNTSDRKRKRTDSSFQDKYTNPTVRTIVWQSHYLVERGCTIELHWIPRNVTYAALLADEAAGLWREEARAIFSQSNLAREERDGIMDKVSEEVNEIVRGRLTPPPTMTTTTMTKTQIMRQNKKRKKASQKNK
ncbi:hypothetical protein QBC32DRAFT_407218 [Pseudoneurospora amorphoporcata]|uniref:Uncharacterized protein n=1 Tax=Pseudoneurospora amorphoporcata TaxID=241081 RepID=A0AAN6SDK7_9PEZI|nr:hypothetical protein QBC32DRAFT_407218 [Pseudoneurospora amorphoporcata]